MNKRIKGKDEKSSGLPNTKKSFASGMELGEIWNMGQNGIFSCTTYGLLSLFDKCESVLRLGCEGRSISLAPRAFLRNE